MEGLVAPGHRSANKEEYNLHLHARVSDALAQTGAKGSRAGTDWFMIRQDGPNCWQVIKE